MILIVDTDSLFTILIVWLTMRLTNCFGWSGFFGFFDTYTPLQNLSHLTRKKEMSYKF